MLIDYMPHIYADEPSHTSVKQNRWSGTTKCLRKTKIINRTKPKGWIEKTL